MVTDMNKWRVRDTGQIYKDEVGMNFREKGDGTETFRVSGRERVVEGQKQGKW